MAIRGFFEPAGWPATTQRLSLRGGLAGDGIKVEGPVLEGRLSVEEAMVLSWIRAGGDREVKVEVARAVGSVLPGPA